MNDIFQEKKPQKTFITVKGEKNESLDELPFIEYKIKGADNQLYSLKIFQNNKYILFYIYINNTIDFNSIIYKKEVLLEEFYNLNRFFRQYLSLEELFTILFKNLKNKEIKIYKKDDKIKLSFIVECRGKEEEIPFILYPEQSTIENIIDNIYEKVKEIENQKESNNNLLKELKQFKEYIINQNQNKFDFKTFLSFIFSVINYFKINMIYLIIVLFCIFIEWIVIKNLKNEIIYLKNDLKKYDNNYINSRIIKNYELDLFEDDIAKMYNKKIDKYVLLYRASRDGYSSLDFHNKCDGKANTITFVKTKTGKRFGGYTDLVWDRNHNYNINKLNIFNFNIDEKDIYYNKYTDFTKKYNSKYGPILEGDSGFKISDNCDIIKSYFNNKDSEDYNSYYNDTQGTMHNKRNKNKYNNYFYVREYEVYQIIFLENNI